MLLRRSSFYLRVYIANETRSDEDRKELTEYLHHQLDKLGTETKRVATVRTNIHTERSILYGSPIERGTIIIFCMHTSQFFPTYL